MRGRAPVPNWSTTMGAAAVPEPLGASCPVQLPPALKQSALPACSVVRVHLGQRLPRRRGRQPVVGVAARRSRRCNKSRPRRWRPCSGWRAAASCARRSECRPRCHRRRRARRRRPLMPPLPLLPPAAPPRPAAPVPAGARAARRHRRRLVRRCPLLRRRPPPHRRRPPSPRPRRRRPRPGRRHSFRRRHCHRRQSRPSRPGRRHWLRQPSHRRPRYLVHQASTPHSRPRDRRSRPRITRVRCKQM